jgi:hypothetical protein
MNTHKRIESFNRVSWGVRLKNKLNFIKNIIFLYLTVCATISHAEQRFSCKAATVSGEINNFKPRIYGDTYPTILLNIEEGKLVYLYYQHDRRWEREYAIFKYQYPMV